MQLCPDAPKQRGPVSAVSDDGLLRRSHLQMKEAKAAKRRAGLEVLLFRPGVGRSIS